MLTGIASRTAERVALRRAAHQVFDSPVVFHDPLALRILGLTGQHVRSGELRAPTRATSRSLRAFLVARSLFAERTLASAVTQGCAQYVLLGAGLDTFAYRNPHPALQVYEVDHPATQAWKQQRLQAGRIPVPANCTHVPVDFEQDGLIGRLAAAGFRKDRPSLFAWLGVLPYLSAPAMQSTLEHLGSLPAPTGLVLDYGLPRHLLSPEEQLRFDSLSARVAQAGEPFRLFFTPAQIAQELARYQFHVVEDLDTLAMNDRYFCKRADGLQVLGSATHLLYARNLPER